MPRSGAGKSRADGARHDGFTLVEVVISLFIVGAALVLVLLSIQRGLEHVESSRREFQVFLDLETFAGSLALGLDQPGDYPWQTIESSPLPELELVMVTVPAAGPPVVAWLVPPEPGDGAPDNEAGAR